MNPKRSNDLDDAVAFWPTPNARDHKDTGPNVDWEKVEKKKKLAGSVNWPPTETAGPLSYRWVEQLMGFPEGWVEPDGPPLRGGLSTSGNTPAPNTASSIVPTSSEPSGTPSSPRSPSSSDATCSAAPGDRCPNCGWTWRAHPYRARKTMTCER